LKTQDYSDLEPIWRDFFGKNYDKLPTRITPFLAKNLEKWSNPDP